MPHTTRNKESKPKPKQYIDQILRMLVVTSSADRVRCEPFAEDVNIAPFPIKHWSTQSYYEQFLPMIIEESRAQIQHGYECFKNDTLAAHKYRIISCTKEAVKYSTENSGTLFTLGLHSDESFNETFMGDSVVLLTHQSLTCEFLALVVKYVEKKSLTVQVHVSSSFYKQNTTLFADPFDWQVTVLAPLNRLSRMYSACIQADGGPCIQSIINGKSFGLTSNVYSLNYREDNNLNAEQQRVANFFIKHQSQGLTLLQGPPGTGKSTTIVSIVESLRKQKKRVIVTASANKSVQLLAGKVYQKDPSRILLICAEEKASESLAPIFFHVWYKRLLRSFYILNRISTELLQAQEYAPQLLIDKRTEIRSHLNEISIKFNTSDFIQKTLDRGFLDCWKKIIDSDTVNDSQAFQAANSQSVKNYTILKNLDGDEVERKLLQQSNIILFSTLTVLGRERLLNQVGTVETLIIDEASQATEAETLIAFQYKPTKALLVGDPKQLAPIVLSQLAIAKHYDWSIMERLMEQNRSPHFMLTRQYRMHPAICLWSSNQFYSGQLKTGEGTAAYKSVKDIEELDHIPFVFYHIKASSLSENPYFNEAEAKLAVFFAERLRVQYGSNCSIGIITFYAEQKKLISNKVFSALNIIVDTVDAFQGTECDFIILSCVRSNNNHAIGFLNDQRRLNVAMTRAKQKLIIVGDAETLGNDPCLKSIIDYAIHLDGFSKKYTNKFVDSPPHRRNNLRTISEDLSYENEETYLSKIERVKTPGFGGINLMQEFVFDELKKLLQQVKAIQNNEQTFSANEIKSIIRDFTEISLKYQAFLNPVVTIDLAARFILKLGLVFKKNSHMKYSIVLPTHFFDVIRVYMNCALNIKNENHNFGVDILYGMGLMVETQLMHGSVMSQDMTGVLDQLVHVPSTAQDIGDTFFALGLMAKKGCIQGALNSKQINVLIERWMSLYRDAEGKHIVDFFCDLSLIAAFMEQPIDTPLIDAMLARIAESLYTVKDITDTVSVMRLITEMQVFQEPENNKPSDGLLKGFTQFIAAIKAKSIDDKFVALKEVDREINIDNQARIFGEFFSMIEGKSVDTIENNKTISDLFGCFMATDPCIKSIQNTLHTIGLMTLSGILVDKQVTATLNSLMNKNPTAQDISSFFEKLGMWIKARVIEELLSSDLNSIDSKESEKVFAMKLYGLMWLIEAGVVHGIPCEKIWTKIEGLTHVTFDLSIRIIKPFESQPSASRTHQNIANKPLKTKAPAIVSPDKSPLPRLVHKDNNNQHSFHYNPMKDLEDVEFGQSHMQKHAYGSPK